MENPIVIAAFSGGIAALVSTLITLVSQHLERKARRDELLMTKALEMAVNWTEFVYNAAKDQEVRATVVDPVVLSETYFKWLSHLMKKKELPEEAKKQLKKFMDMKRK